MFVITTVVDTIRIPSTMLSIPTLDALHNEIDLKYPNRVVMDIGLVVCRYGSCLKITNGSCVPGDGGSHHECLFQLVVFRPFVEEVCIGKIIKSTSSGIQVSLGGFFQDIFIPTYWMLRPSHYDERSKLWIWTPEYNDDEEVDENVEEVENDDSSKKLSNLKETKDDKDKTNKDGVTIKTGDAVPTSSVQNKSGNDKKDGEDDNDTPKEENEEEEVDHFEMEIGAEIRFKVKSIQFTQITNTAKGLQATTTTTDHSQPFSSSNNNTSATSGGSGSAGLKEEKDEGNVDKPISLRKRSTSVDLSERHKLPASMHIVASICEDGLGLTSWWSATEEEEGEADDEGEGE